MTAYSVDFTVRNDDRVRTLVIDAKDLKSARRKIGRRLGYKDGRMIKIQRVDVIGYF